MRKRKTVVLIMEKSFGYDRGLLRGIVKYSNLRGPWNFYRELPFYTRSMQGKNFPSKVEKINVDGAILREPSSSQIEQFIKLKIPLIISPHQANSQIPAIRTDVKKIGQLAAEHFIERGFKNFAYCGFQGVQSSKDRYESFAREIEHRNYQVHKFFAPANKLINLPKKYLTNIISWLHSLPKPVGLMTCNDDMGQIILDICKLAGFYVPKQIAVLGVDNDEFVCEMTVPPLSSIAFNYEKGGYETAKLLDKLMSGKKMNGQIIDLEPSNIVTRQSTDVIATEDKEIIQAIKYIQENAREPITIDNVARKVNLSRRHLYRKFMKVMGHSVFDEIKINRINYICKLLLETNWSIYKITMSLGFTEIAHISRYFKNEKGMSPNQYRKKFRP